METHPIDALKRFSFYKEGMDAQRKILRYSSLTWLCSDNDMPTLDIDIQEDGMGGGFAVNCISGIPASSVYIDEVDFGVFWKKASLGAIGNDTHKPTYYEQVFAIADYICSLFCEKYNATEK